MKNSIRSLSLLLALAAGLAGFSSPASTRAQAADAAATSPRRANHVIIIGVDGLSPDGVRKAETPTLDHMMAKGAWSLHARGVLPTSSSANWASMIGGVGPEQHGVITNDWRVGEFGLPASVIGSGGFFPSIFQVLHDQHPDWEVGSIYHWGGFGNLYDHRFVDYDANGADEDETTALAVSYIKAKRPAFLFVHLDHVDHAGHAYGHGTAKYYASVTKADELIAQIRQAAAEAGILDETVFIVTSDHGGVGKGHGGDSLAELEIPWILYGKGVKAGQALDLPINTFDTPATAAWLLGADLPYAWLGRPIRSALTGEASPRLTYRASSLFASPVIEPAGQGNDPAGGLFINQTAQMTIQNPNAIGEVRYTLDGATPTGASPLYAGPVEISRNTLVRATLFIDGQPASVPASAQFRILNLNASEPRGVTYKTYLLPDGSVRLPDFTRLEPASSGATYEVSLKDVKLPREDDVAVVFEGLLRIDAAGIYSFTLASDDGSKLYIGDRTVVDNDGDHGVIAAQGSANLEPGLHLIRVEWFNGGGGAWLGAYFEGPGIPRQFIDPNRLSPR